MNSNAVTYAVILAVLVIFIVLTQRWQKGERTPFSLLLARALRRVGRWFWAVGEGVEIGYHHNRKVKRQIRIELETKQ
jgi:hypothetical protein